MSAVVSVFSTILLSPFVAGITYFVVSRGVNFKINKIIYLVLLFTAWLFSMSNLSVATGGLTEQENKNERIFYPLSILFACMFISLLVVKQA
jgi:membrane protein insertase Oxa1/YidC/SpoIIIJ